MGLEESAQGVGRAGLLGHPSTCTTCCMCWLRHRMPGCCITPSACSWRTLLPWMGTPCCKGAAAGLCSSVTLQVTLPDCPGGDGKPSIVYGKCIGCPSLCMILHVGVSPT